MNKELRHWLGMAGVPAHDSPRAYQWERRLNWVMVGIALLAIPAFYLEAVQSSEALRHLGWEIDVFICLAFLCETLWMTYLCRHRSQYLRGNWLNLLIIFGSGLGLLGLHSEWVSLVRLLRVVYVALIVARILSSLRSLFSPTAIPFVLILGLLTLTLAGAGFYWLEPTVHTLAEGMWLAFTTGATVGYGDFVPTTPASRVFAVLMVMAGLTVLSLVTASVSAFFIGEDEKEMRKEMHRDIRALRAEVAKLRADLEKRGLVDDEAAHEAGRTKVGS